MFTDTYTDSDEQLSNAIVNTSIHEIGHLLGLFHLDDPFDREVMTSDSKINRDNIFNVRSLTDADLALSGFPDELGNSFCTLNKYLNFKNTCSENVTDQAIANLNFSAENSIYNPFLVIDYGYDDAGLTYISIDDLEAQSINIPFLNSSVSIGIIGSSIEGGKVDIFSEGSLSLSAIIGDININDILLPFDDLQLSIDLFKKTDDQFEQFTSLDINLVSNAVPEPTIIALMGLGIFGLALSRRRMK